MPEVRVQVAISRRHLIVRDLDVGSRFSKSHDLDCVTLEGDSVNRKGALSGGYTDLRRSRLRAQLDRLRLREALAASEAELAAVVGEGERLDAEVTRVLPDRAKTSPGPFLEPSCR